MRRHLSNSCQISNWLLSPSIMIPHVTGEWSLRRITKSWRWIVWGIILGWSYLQLCVFLPCFNLVMSKFTGCSHCSISGSIWLSIYCYSSISGSIWLSLVHWLFTLQWFRVGEWLLEWQGMQTCQLFKISMGDFARSNISKNLKFTHFVVMPDYSTIF